MAAGDPRVRLRASLAESEIAAHDLLVVPARLEAWSEAVMRGMAAGLPILATPVGGLVEQVGDGVTGWLTDDFGSEPLRQALAALASHRGAIEAVAGSGAIAKHQKALADPDAVLASYREIAARRPSRRRPPRLRQPSVTGIVPYHGADQFVTVAVESLLSQTHPVTEVLIINDGSFEPEDQVLETLAADSRVTVVTQPSRGEGSARDLGARLAHGQYLVMLDADNLLEPRFVERALKAFEHDPALAYVSCWLRMVDEAGRELEAPAGYSGARQPGRPRRPAELGR